MADQPDGSYPRLNCAMVKSGNYREMIVSLVGKFKGAIDANSGLVAFECADGGTINLSLNSGEPPSAELTAPDGPAVEIVGQVMSTEEVLLFVTRVLSKDMDLSVYDKMLSVQHNPKFEQYFKPLAAGTNPSPMVTN